MSDFLLEYMIAAHDERRERGMRSFVRSMCAQFAQDAFARQFPPPRYVVDYVRLAIPHELAESAGDGTFIRELLEAAGEDELAYTADCP